MEGSESSREERKLAAIMFTDLVGFTTLTQTEEALAMEILSKHGRIVRPIFEKYSGRLIKSIGDSFLVEFPNALDAVRCAVELQEEHRRAFSSQSKGRASIRIGVHVGDVIHERGDIFGDAVNISSRIEPLANPDGVCISEQVYDQVQNKVRFHFVKIPSPKLKNVNLPIDVYRIEMPWDESEDIAELDRTRVAVLPLSNLSPDPNDEYFSDGMTEELITALSGITGLTVIARTSVMPYKTVSKRVFEIGHELNAGTVIEGSVRKSANKVRIAVQVIDAKNEGHLWATNYDRELNDVFAIQSEIAEKVAASLKIRLLDSDRKKLAKSPTGSVEAHTLYLKGRYYWNNRSRENIEKAIEYFKLAVEQDEKFALGYSGLGECYAVMGRNGLSNPAEAFPKAKEYVTKALDIDPDLSEGHSCLANIFDYYEHRPKSSELEHRRAIELNPSNATAHQWFAHLLGHEKRFSEAFSEIMRAAELDPLSRIINLNVGDGYYYLEEYEKAIEQYKKVIDMDPKFSPVYLSLIEAYLEKLMYDESLAAAEKYGELSKKPFETKLWKARICATKQDKESSRKLLSDVEEHFHDEVLSQFRVGVVHFLLGETDLGFEWLNRAYDEKDPEIALMNIEPELEGVRRDPRFLSLLEKLGLSEYEFRS